MRKKINFGTDEIKCPFFRCHEVRIIGCEGVTDDSLIRIVYRNRKSREAQERIFCEDKYQNCEIYRMIMSAKYDD